MCDCVFVGTPKSESFVGVWILSLHSVDASGVRRVDMKYHDHSLYHQIVSYCCHGDGSGGRHVCSKKHSHTHYYNTD